MPSPRSYQVNNLHKVSEEDQSYRSCLLALIIFFFLCMILILVSLPWKKGHLSHPKSHEEDPGTAEHHHHDHQETTTTRRSVIPVTLSEPKETMFEFDVSTQDYDTVNATNESTNSSKFERILGETTTEEGSESTASATDNEVITERDDRLVIANNTEGVTSTTEAEETTVDGQDVHTTQSSTYSTNVTTEDVPDNVTEITSTTEESTTETTSGIRQDIFLRSTMSMTEGTTTEPPSTTTDSSDEEVCTTGECKNMASKMLFYMNHTVDPCEDFYEYACGGFEASPCTVEQDLEDVAYQRILRQMQKETREGKSSLFAEYYDSCLQYENVGLSERIRLAKQTLDEVGKFYTAEEWDKSQPSFTELLAKLLLRNSALLFDLSPDLDEYSPKQFTFKIGPTTYKNPFDAEVTDDPCYASQFEREQDTVDLGKLYKEYKTCKNNPGKFIKSIAEALVALNVFNQSNPKSNISQEIQTTVIKIDFEIVQNLFANYPTEEKIREAYLMKNYTRVTIEKLDQNYKVVNWTQLIRLLTHRSLTTVKIDPTVKVQVYFYDVLAEGLKTLEQFKATDPMQLNNAVLGLYAHHLYQELVLPKQRNIKEYCLRVAANLLIPEASKLYVSSFTSDQLGYMNDTIHGLFENLKETLKLNVEKVEWIAPEGRKALIAKIDDLKVAVPDVSYLTNDSSVYNRNAGAYKTNISDNYFENSVTLMQRYRTLIYGELFTNPGSPEEIWTHYATPFQSKGLAIYGLNLVAIPFGVIDWSTKYNELSFNYTKLATLGNVIAHQIAHHFDANGIYYWNGTRDDENSLLSDDEGYINDQRNILYQSPMNMTIPSTGQTIGYEILQVSLNERLSETMGLRLAYDTLGRLRSSPEEVHLPWLKLNIDQLFYLTYAQMHCTKSPLTSSYISLYENEQLPSRIRIFVSASNNKLLGEAWNCPDGTPIMPSYTCSPFPYLQCN